MRGTALSIILLPAASSAAIAHAPEHHVGGVDAWTWSSDPWVVLPLALSAVLYFAGARRLWAQVRGGAEVQRRRAALFTCGWLVAGLALVSPIDTIGGELFAVHMVQHELLMLVAAPLLVLSAPGAVFAWSLPTPLRRPVSGSLGFARALWRFLTRPLPAWLLHAVVLWVWHVPYLFQASLLSDLVHTAQHVTFFLAALVFWWSLLNAVGGHGVGVLSLFTTAIHSSLLGALLTLTPNVWYPLYGETAPHWGLTPLEDQQLGGLIMWVPGGIVFLVAAIWVLAQGLAQSERRAQQRDALGGGAEMGRGQ